ncbi:MAG: hypothetical protein WDW36_006187 [Sanguina aurantia]
MGARAAVSCCALEENTVMLSTMKASKFFKVFDKEISHWEASPLGPVSQMTEHSAAHRPLSPATVSPTRRLQSRDLATELACMNIKVSLDVK